MCVFIYIYLCLYCINFIKTHTHGHSTDDSAMTLNDSVKCTHICADTNARTRRLSTGRVRDRAVHRQWLFGVDSGCPQRPTSERAWTVAVHRGLGCLGRGQWLFTGGSGPRPVDSGCSQGGLGARGVDSGCPQQGRGRGAWTVAVHKRVGPRGVDSGCPQGVGGGAGRGQWLSTGVGGPGAWTAAVHREWGGGRAWTVAVDRGVAAEGVDSSCPQGGRGVDSACPRRAGRGRRLSTGAGGPGAWTGAVHMVRVRSVVVRKRFRAGVCKSKDWIGLGCVHTHHTTCNNIAWL